MRKILNSNFIQTISRSFYFMFMSICFSTLLYAQTGSIDLSISNAAATPNPVNSGSNVTFSITVNGPSSATGVMVTTMLPSQMAFVSGTPNCTNNRGTVACSIGALTSGTANVSITATATNPGTSPITVKTVAGVVGDQHDANMANNSAVSQITVNPVQAPPNPPSGLIATVISNCRINLQWTDNSNNETGFDICVRGSATSPCLWFAQVTANTTTYSHTGLLPNTTYRYSVRAFRTGFPPSTPSNEVAKTTLASLAAPALVSPAQGATNVAIAPSLSWNAVTNATSYEVQVATDAGFANILRCGSGLSTTNWIVTPALKTGTQYHWRARAANSCSKGAWSTSRNFITVSTLRSHDLVVNAAGNSVFEPGETVIVAPTWQNPTGSPVPSVTGSMTSFTGPGAPTVYSMPDTAAAYGTIAANSTANCQTATGNCYSLALTNPTRPMQHWDATAVETVTGTSPMSWQIHIGNSFSDVPTSNLYYKFIETIFHNGITSGCGNNNYCPTATVTRDQIAVMLLLSKDGKCYAPPSCSAGTELFLDVPASNPFCSWIEELARRNITSGCSAGNYCPSAPITREQISIFLLKAKEGGSYTPPACAAGSTMFADVPATSPYCPYIEELVRRGATSGCGGGNYCPTATVSREQLSVFLTTIFNLTLYKP